MEQKLKGRQNRQRIAAPALKLNSLVVSVFSVLYS